MSLFVLTLSEDSSSTPDAKKGINLGVPGSSSDQEELQGNEVAAGVVHAIPVASLGLSPIRSFSELQIIQEFLRMVLCHQDPKAVDLIDTRLD